MTNIYIWTPLNALWLRPQKWQEVEESPRLSLNRGFPEKELTGLVWACELDAGNRHRALLQPKCLCAIYLNGLRFKPTAPAKDLKILYAEVTAKGAAYVLGAGEQSACHVLAYPEDTYINGMPKDGIIIEPSFRISLKCLNTETEEQN